MDLNQFNELSGGRYDSTFNIKDIFQKYLAHLKWFVICVLVFALGTYFYLMTMVPEYRISATILIKDEEKESSFADLSAFEGLSLLGGGDKGLENEIIILKSRKLMSKVVEELKLNTRYFIESSPYDKEVYPNFPIIINYESDSIQRVSEEVSTEFEVIVRSESSFDFVDFADRSKTHSFGEFFEANLGNDNASNKQMISLELSEDFAQSIIGKSIYVRINPIDRVVSRYMDKITIEPLSDNVSQVLNVSINGAVIEKGEALINNLIEQYNADGINDKNQIAQTTTNFLDSRLELISTELMAIEGTAEQFKTRNRMVDASSSADIYLQSSSNNERELIAANTQLELLNFMIEELKKSGKGDLLPGNIGLSDPAIVNLVTEYNNLMLQRNRIIKSSSDKNPIIVNIDSQLTVLKRNLMNSLGSSISSTEIQIQALNTQGGKINSRIASVPKNEREYKDIVRQQETKNALYLFLLQKREESILSNAVSINKSKIIDEAYSNGLPVAPKKKIILLASMFLGLLFPFSIIYIREMLDTKVHGEKDVEKLNIPYLGDIPLVSNKKDVLIKDGDVSPSAEAFRYIRTNINFMLNNNDQCKVIYITSTQSQEGKTVTGINLASSFALSGKKTLLLGMDLRAPKIGSNLGLTEKIGVTNYIMDSSITVDNLLLKSPEFDNLHIITSGDIPPNPVELLMNTRVEELFEALKSRYDYIIVDTAPVGMVTDTLQIAKYSDLSIYVFKANFLDKRMLGIPSKLHTERKLPNMALLINASDQNKMGYGYGYGYGKVKNDDKPWYRRAFNL